MTVTKAIVRSILIAGLAVPSAQASSMLVLGVNTNSGSTPSYSTSSSAFNSSYFQPTPAAGLTLGVMSNVGSYAPAAPVQTVSAPVQNSTFTPAAAPQVAAAPAPAMTSTGSGTYDASINFGTGPFLNANSLTTGNAQAWYLSAAVDKLYGGVPTAQQQASFDSTVLQRVQQTFSLSGVPVNLTDNPNASAAHSLSVVSQTTNPTLPNAIGMTYIGGNGFHFIDNSASAAQSVDQLEWIVAHNISHELMLAFGVPENYDTSGNYIDARNASWSMITNPNATFSNAAAAALLAQNFQSGNSSSLYQGAQILGAETVPEPTTLALWVAIAGAGFLVRRGRKAARV